DTFQALSAEALKSNHETFLHLAESRLREARVETTAEVDERKRAIEHLLAPMKTTLEQVEREIKESERHRLQAGTELLNKLASLDTVGQTLRTETARLVDALKRPGVRGRWGELQLKRVVELAGMVEHCDFEEQHTIVAATDNDRRLRPDVIVRLAGGKHVVIDAKVPLDAYLKALEAPDESTRQALLADHAKQVRAHLSHLASKSYATHVQPGPDFVVMFLPGEMFFSAALEQDPSLIEFGVEQRVVPATPTIRSSSRSIGRRGSFSRRSSSADCQSRMPKSRKSARRPKHHHTVYVVYLRNPKGDGNAAYYVGMTGLPPEQRCANHKSGIKAAGVVRRFGERLVPKLYAQLNPMPYARA